MVFYGADVEALRTLATSMERAADSLSRSIGNVDGALHNAAAWKGPWADRFRSQWTGIDRRKLSSSSSDLRTVARTLRANADAQEQVSRADAGSTSSALPSKTGDRSERAGLSFKDVVSGLDSAVSGLSNLLEAGGWLNETFEKATVPVKSGLGPFGLVLGGIGTVMSVSEDIEQRENVQAAVDGFFGTVGTGLGIAGTATTGAVAAGLGAVGLGVSGLAGLVYISSPITQEASRSTMDFALKERFGQAASVDDPTSAEADWMLNRYSGPLGPVNMVSDRMDSTIGVQTTRFNQTARQIMRQMAASGIGGSGA